jgi:hypothetical protein
MRKYLNMPVVLLLLVGAILPAASQRSLAADSLLKMEREPLLEQSLFRMAYKSVRQKDRFAPDGASALNRRWEQGGAAQWFVEEQKFGPDLLLAGIVLRDEKLTDLGWKAVAWGFSRQAPGGDFPGTGDPFHSVSIFVEAAARTLRLMKESGEPRYAATIAEFGPKLRGAALWLLNPEASAEGRKRDAPYTHRRYILAAALGQTAAVADDPVLWQASLAYAREGLALQRPDGVNPEKNGFDVSYQGVSVLMAGRYWGVCPEPSVRGALRAMMQKALDYELTKLDDQGKLSVAGSTRMGAEPGRGGRIKTVNYKEVVEGMVLAATITGDRRFHDAAAKIALGQGFLPPSVQEQKPAR